MGMPGRHERMVVTDMAECEDLLCIIHDEFFDVDDIRYDSDTGTVDIPFGRVFHDENATVVKSGFFRRIYEVPVLRCVLRIGNVTDFALEDTQKMGTYDFNVIDYNKASGKLTIKTGIPLKLFMTVTALHLEYFELDFKGKARITEGLFLQSGPRFIED